MNNIFPYTQLPTPHFALAKSAIGTDDMVAGGSDMQQSNFIGIGRKQMGHSSLAGGVLEQGLIA
jgi:hypothetical protein